MRLLSVLFLFMCMKVVAQPLGNNIGVVKGIAVDSVHQHLLKAATITVLYEPDQRIFGYQLSNGYGEFNFTGLPLKQPFKLIISYVGYVDCSKSFILDSANHVIDFHQVSLEQIPDSLETVIVQTIAPIRMNKDTLEINPRALQMGPNDVVEDVLRKVTGVVVWSDGTITVNGREVKSVLVEGKPFFGGASNIALQNLPSSAVDKIQVYQQKGSGAAVSDSITEVNVKLRKDNKKGLFGKVEAGYGSRERFDVTGNVNFYTPNDQLSVVAETNNVNKVAGDMSTLLENSAYKGNHVLATTFEPDFRLPGVNRRTEGGASYQHDFIGSPNSLNYERLKGDYYYNNSKNTTLTDLINTRYQENSDYIQNVSHSESGDRVTEQQGHFAYQLRKENLQNSIGIDYRQQDRDYFNATSELTVDKGVSKSQRDNQVYGDQTNHNLILLGQLIKSPGLNYGSRVTKSIRYSVDIGDEKDERRTENAFTVFLSPLENLLFNRVYASEGRHVKAKVEAAMTNLGNLRIGNRMLFTWNMNNDLELDLSKGIANISDFDTTMKGYYRNTFLSNNTDYRTVDESPSLVLNRSFSKGLTDRFDRTLQFNVAIKGQYFSQRASSDNSALNVNQQYTRFTPRVDIRWDRYRAHKVHNGFSLGWDLTYVYPRFDQLTALPDSTNMYDLVFGNRNLQPSKKNLISFSWQHEPMGRQGGKLAYDFSLQFGRNSNMVTDSTIISNDGKSLKYFINHGNYDFTQIAIKARQSFKLSNQTIQPFFYGQFRSERFENYINSQLANVSNLRMQGEIGLYYSFGNVFSLSLKDQFNFNKTLQQTAEKTTYNTSYHKTSFSASTLLAGFVLNSDVNFYNSVATSQSIRSTIWNASLTHRFLKQENLELKLSAYDLLRQSKGIINSTFPGYSSIGSTNMLQNYWLFSIAFYPRNFKL